MTRSDRIFDANQAGLSISVIARKEKVSESTVRHHLRKVARRRGIPTLLGNGGRPPLVIPEALVEKYKKRQLSQADIADILKCHVSTVGRRLKKLGAPSHANVSDPDYKRQLHDDRTGASGKRPLTPAQMVRKYGVSVRTINRHIADHRAHTGEPS